jgi:hypothetical protein
MTNTIRTSLLRALCATGLLLGGGLAQAGVPLDGWERASAVTDVVTPTGPGEWTYEFTVINNSTRCDPFVGNPDCEFTEGLDPVIIDWELPYFPDMGIDNIVSPDGWTYSIETIGVAGDGGWSAFDTPAWWDPADPWYSVFGPDSPFGENNLTQVLHWYAIDTSLCNSFADVAAAGVLVAPPCPGIVPVESFIPGYNNSLGGFSFTAAYDPAAAPYQASWLFLPSQSGDPAFPFGGLPGSPSVTGASGVPLPSAWLLFGGGALLLAGTMARRHRR